MYIKFFFNQTFCYFFLLLSTALVTVVHCDRESATRDLSVCNKACTDDFFPKLYTFIADKQRNNDGFGEIKSFWSTCQYRCYRCRIPGANDAMDTIEWKFTHDQQSIPGTFIELVTLVSQVEYSLRNCMKQWGYFNRHNDETSTVDRG